MRKSSGTFELYFVKKKKSIYHSLMFGLLASGRALEEKFTISARPCFILLILLFYNT